MANPWTADLFTDRERDECGISASDFANALSVWSFMQQRPVSVAEAAATFNVTPLMVAAAVEGHPYLLHSGDGGPATTFIEHDGE